MTPKQLVESRGYAVLPSFHPALSPTDAASVLGTPEMVEGLRLVHELVPMTPDLTTPNTYSGNFGLGSFPLHTDLAHWAKPPRYLMLRCAVGDPEIETNLIDARLLVESVGSSMLSRCLAQPRRPINGALQLLPIWQPETASQRQLIRWDSIYLRPANDYAQGVFQRVADWLSAAQSNKQVLLDQGDTLLLDNWRMLHGRSAASSSASSRKVHRLYLDSLI